jgi:hypothetical protein
MDVIIKAVDYFASHNGANGPSFEGSPLKGGVVAFREAFGGKIVVFEFWTYNA